jgi:GTPase
MFRNNSSADYIARSAKVVTLVDLAGHEKYFKTTAFGLTGHLPDYACLILGANAGTFWLHSCCTYNQGKDHEGIFFASKFSADDRQLLTT